METRQSGRKRANSSISDSRDSSPVSHRTRQSAAAMEKRAVPPAATCTPRRSRKRVRFSDPGPRLLHDTNACSTGLTPAMRRTFFNSFSRPGNCTPSRKARRRSAPTPRFGQVSDPGDSFDKTSEQVVQFTPLRQILDSRTQRRIRRFGLSDEINHIEREKRQATSYSKTLAALRQERDSLQQELNVMRQPQENTGGQLPSDQSFWTSPQLRGRQLEEETTQLHDGVSVASGHSVDAHAPSVNNEGDIFMLNDSAVITSNSPDFRGVRNYCSPVSDGMMLCDQTNTDVSTQTRVLDSTEMSDLHTLTLDLEAARNEKRDLFNVCRSHISVFENFGMDNSLRQSSPPPDFLDSLIGTLTTALSRASDATQALEGISQECSELGFSGTSPDQVMSDIRDHFRSARLELERAIPGETPDAGLEDGKATLGALVKRVRSLAKDLRAERKHHYGSQGREKALRRQFDNLLHRYEAASDKIGNLEDSIASSASDMLHTRIRMQDLENQDQEKTIGIDRLNTALDKYREDVKSLEELVGRLEGENLAAKKQYTQQISTLRAQVVSERRQRSAVEISASEYGSRIRELEETVEQNRIRACDLTAQVEALEKEHRKALDTLDQKTQAQTQQHEEETGTLNVRISELTTSLEGARSEAQRLRQINNGLEDQLQMEITARDELVDKWAAEQARSFAFMKETVNSERRRAKVRAANWELKSDDLMSDGTTGTGSDPITPVSMTRFVDVEMGRGKGRRRMDSGIGILTEEELLEDEELADIQRGLDSDIDLPGSDLIDV
ncbi:uncharacterized protein N7459_008825 [Penicillium hispanicum]|uniref:uncharacterized protein n=1 Tax=Penicillium hispanicum TaxID=1080232 RepID=UPI00253FCB48|nr:uncharacterized protein N7459_008825 [Penicillium hispanicum]KAJ5574398.1 hypothetical protein N7459_008825 [Penicillium hispanicum]